MLLRGVATKAWSHGRGPIGRAQRRAIGAALCAAGLTLAGCAPTLHYHPNLAELEVPASDASGLGVRVLATVAGYVKADTAHEQPAGIEIRLRVENRGEQPVQIEAGSLQLLASDLTAFGTPRIEGAEGLDVAPGDTGVVAGVFPFPAGLSPDSEALRALNLHWILDVGDARSSQSVTFDRVDPETYVYTYPSYYGPGWWWEPAYVVVRDPASGHHHER